MKEPSSVYQSSDKITAINLQHAFKVGARVLKEFLEEKLMRRVITNTDFEEVVEHAKLVYPFPTTRQYTVMKDTSGRSFCIIEGKFSWKPAGALSTRPWSLVMDDELPWTYKLQEIYTQLSTNPFTVIEVK